MTSDESYQTRGSSSEGMSLYTQFSHSTPLKANSRSVTRNTVSEERAGIAEPEVDGHFVENFFVALDTVPDVKDDSVQQSISIIKAVDGEVNMYKDLVLVFNTIAQSICAAGHSPAPLHFMCSPSIGPASKNRQQTRHIKPDIFVLPPLDVSEKFLQEMAESNVGSPDPSFRCPWSVLESMVEVKPDGQWRPKQAIDYLETILQHRPDKVNVLGVCCNQVGYRFYYSDACTQKTSEEFKWDEGLENLVRYVYSLHRIFTDDIGRDKSFQLYDIVWKGIYGSAIWDLSFKGKEYRVRPICERKGLGRRTWIAVGTVNQTNGIGDPKSKSAVRVVKDMWRDNSRRYEEGELLRRIHENGFIPGVVRQFNDGIFDDLTTRNRTKHRLIMGSTGLRLSACKSVLEFLKVIYDAIEAHEKVIGRGVLHRDISWYNVLCRPQHYIGNDNIVDHPNIGKILEEPDAQPLCLLTDFDNAALIQDDKDPNEGAKRTGTPMFIACELAYEEAGYSYLRGFKPLPSITLPQLSLEGEALEKYMNAYKLERYEEYNRLLTSVISGHVKEIDPFAGDNLIPSHQPHHDIESIYWIILWFLAKAWPSESEFPYSGKHSELQKTVLKHIHSRTKLGHELVNVINLLIHPEGVWKVTLHPLFQPLAKMLADMGDYLCMFWSRFPDMPFWHAHEAFKRLLLKEIVRMSNDETPIPIRGPRPSLDKPTPGRSFAVSKSKVGSPRNLTPSGSQSQVHESTESRQSSNATKRHWPNCLGADSGSVAKKPRYDLRSGSTTNAPIHTIDDEFVRVCLEDIEKDDKYWFTL